VLTAELVRVRTQGTELLVTDLSAKVRPRAVALARDYLDLAASHVGATRADLEEAFQQVETQASERKLALGLQKLVEDRLEFDVTGDEDPRTLRATVFLAAATRRKALEDGADFDREAFVIEEARKREMDVALFERTLYGDLRNAQILNSFAAVDPEVLVAGYDLAQKQAVLLRAVDLTADVRCRDPYAYRLLFRKLKFFRLMHQIEARSDGGYRIVIDGPFGLFSASTKYGLALALALPALLACDEYTIRASLRWGKERAPRTFKIEGCAQPTLGDATPHLPEEVATVLERLRALSSEWEPSVSSDILEVRGEGLCVPDLRFVNRQTGEVAYLEVLGYWSREAVWKRVELARKGLDSRVIFAVSSRLRVSETVLADDVPSELYVYKGQLKAQEILARLSAVRA
jgi:uncharacterized protein